MNTEHHVKVSLSQTGEGLAVEMPSGHTVTVPTNDKGITFIFQVLLEQKRLNGAKATLGTLASPTQSMVEKYLKTHKLVSYDSDGKEKKETLTLEDLGL